MNIDKIIIHCSASEWGDVRIIDQWHKERGWSGIGYHFVVCNGRKNNMEYDATYDGMIQSGRPTNKKGAHCKGHNEGSLGICLIGNKNFTLKQYLALHTLLDQLMVEHKLTPDDIYPHYYFNANKSCPNIDVVDLRLLATLKKPLTHLTRGV